MQAKTCERSPSSVGVSTEGSRWCRYACTARGMTLRTGNTPLGFGFEALYLHTIPFYVSYRYHTIRCIL